MIDAELIAIPAFVHVDFHNTPKHVTSSLAHSHAESHLDPLSSSLKHVRGKSAFKISIKVPDIPIVAQNIWMCFGSRSFENYYISVEKRKPLIQWMLDTANFFILTWVENSSSQVHVWPWEGTVVRTRSWHSFSYPRLRVGCLPGAGLLKPYLLCSRPPQCCARLTLVCEAVLPKMGTGKSAFLGAPMLCSTSWKAVNCFLAQFYPLIYSLFIQWISKYLSACCVPGTVWIWHYRDG